MSPNTNRVYLSGAGKRKRKANANATNALLPKLDSFFSIRKQYPVQMRQILIQIVLPKLEEKTLQKRQI